MSTTDVEVLIIGAGPSGIGTAIQLKRLQRTESIQIVEKCNDVGGTCVNNIVMRAQCLC